MKILIVHNSYQQAGGEDTVVAAESDLLTSNGHQVVFYKRHNDELQRSGLLGMVAAGANTVWSSSSAQSLARILAQERPAIAHFHNTFPLVSPAGYYACATAGVPVVQTLHNYRVLCPAATFFRKGRVCESCLGRPFPWPAILHGCYRDSRAQTAVTAAMLLTHRQLGTWWKKVDIYVALSEFSRRKFMEGGLPPERIVVKPNFLSSDPGPKSAEGEYALFVGRLSAEKGLRVLLDGWERLRSPVPLRIAGDGPLRVSLELEATRRGLAHISFLGNVRRNEIFRLMRGARFLVVPSSWYEGFPVTVIEAFACGIPVIASRLGSLEEIVDHGRTGLHFVSGNCSDLCNKVEWAWIHTQELESMGKQARAEFLAKYTAKRNYSVLMDIYRCVSKAKRDFPLAGRSASVEGFGASSKDISSL